MILSSDELEILEYLKSWRGASVSLVEICRCAGGRRKFRETPHWARGMMARLVEANLIEVNDRGHYRSIVEEEVVPPPQKPPKEPQRNQEQTVDENYFPATQDESGIVGENYFPSATEHSSGKSFWLSPQMAEILKKVKKNLGAQEMKEQ